MKKLIAALLSAALLTCTLTGCGPKKTASSGNAYYASAGNAYYASYGNASPGNARK